MSWSHSVVDLIHCDIQSYFLIISKAFVGMQITTKDGARYNSVSRHLLCSSVVDGILLECLNSFFFLFSFKS